MIIGIVTGVICGLYICVFGMWAFLKGQSSAMVIKMGGLPGRKTAKEEKGGGSPSYSEQLGAMFKGTC